MSLLGRPAIEAFSKTRDHGFSVQSFSKRCVDFHWHFHPELELTYIEKGEGIRYVGCSVTPYASGDLCLIGANLPHAYGSHPQKQTGARWIVLHFLPNRFGDEFWSLPQYRLIRLLLKQSVNGISFEGVESAACLAILKKIEVAPSADLGTIYWLELLAMLARFKAKRFLNASSASYDEGETMDRRLPKILAWIDENADSASLSQAAAAETIRMSPQGFSRFFRHHVGRTFHVYVNELRVARACSSLLNSTGTISEIAFESGFNNLANFNRRFREIMGCVPSEYRGLKGR